MPGLRLTDGGLPPALIWVLIAAGFGLFVPLEAVNLLGRNVLAVVLPLYFFQGWLS